MARIAGVDLPKDKRTEIGLTRIYGIGRSVAKKICEEAEIPEQTRVKDLTEEQVNRLRHSIEEGLPTHGQRTKTNARTRKGPRRTVAGKKK